MQIPKNNDLLKNARQLRKKMTPQELRMWYRFFRLYPVKIYKQRIIGNYIVDFYCAFAKLVVEIDGSQHFDDEGRKYDSERTNYLNSLGLLVIRFSNRDINCNFAAVCEKIDWTIQQRMNPLRQPVRADTSPKGGG